MKKKTLFLGLFLSLLSLLTHPAFAADPVTAHKAPAAHTPPAKKLAPNGQIPVAQDVPFFEPTVSYTNGNFFTSFIDIAFDLPDSINIERTYNSKASKQGLFGYGWSSVYENRIEPQTDGSLVLFESGNGAANIFEPIGTTPANKVKIIEQLVELGGKANAYSNASSKTSYKLRLESDPEFRRTESARLLKNPSTAIAEGALFQSVQFGYQVIKKTKDGYIRSDSISHIDESYNMEGKLASIKYAENYEQTLGYNKAGRLERISDSLGRKIEFTLNAQGLIEKIAEQPPTGVSTPGKIATYRYKGIELVEATNAGGKTYTYAYEQSGNHPLIKMGFPGSKSQEMTYYAQSGGAFAGFIKSIKNDAGQKIEFAYSGKSTAVGTFHVALKRTLANQTSPYNESKITYTHVLNKNGELAVSKIETVQTYFNKKEKSLDRHYLTEFNLACGQAEKIFENGKEVLGLTLDDKCRLVKKVDPQQVVEIEFDSKSGNRKKVVRTLKDLSTPMRFEYEFTWTTPERPSGAKRSIISDGKVKETTNLAVVYDRDGFITALATQELEMKLKNDTRGRPVEIIMTSKKPADTDKKDGPDAQKDQKPTGPEVLKIGYTDGGDMKPIPNEGQTEEQAQLVAYDIISQFRDFSEIMDTAYIDFSFE